MNSLSSIIPLTLLIITIPFLITIQAKKSDQNLINTTCKTSSNTDPNIDYNFCTTSLQAAPASQCATLQGLGTISMTLILNNITDTRCYTKRVMENGKWDPYLRQCLGDCFDLFSDAIPSVKEAMRFYEMKRFDDANARISSVMDGATTCEDGFKEKSGVVSPLSKKNDDAFQLSALALSVMHIVQTESG